MKMLLPIGLAIIGLGAGVGAGMALKPAPEEHAADACAEVEPAAAADHGEAEAAADHGEAEAAHGDDETGADAAESPAMGCPAVGEANPLDPVPAAAKGGGGGGHGEENTGPAVVALDKPFVVPVFGGEKVVAMVVVSVAIEIGAESQTAVEAVQPRLRDTFLAAMFRHANSGGFDGAFTTGQKMEDLRSALLAAAQAVFTGKAVTEVLITEIARQDV